MDKLSERQKKKKKKKKTTTTTNKSRRTMKKYGPLFPMCFRFLSLSHSLFLPWCVILPTTTWFDHRIDDDKSLTVRSHPWLSPRLFTWSIETYLFAWLFIVQVNRSDDVPRRSVIDRKQIISFNCLCLGRFLCKHQEQHLPMISKLSGRDQRSQRPSAWFNRFVCVRDWKQDKS